MEAPHEKCLGIDDLPDAHVVIGPGGEVLQQSTAAGLLTEGIMSEVAALCVESLSFDIPLPGGRCLRAHGREVSRAETSVRVVRLTDVTNELVNEARLQQFERIELLGLFALGIAHDFNNLLTVVVANAEHLILNRSLQQCEDADEVLTEMVRVGQRGAQMVQRLLAFSRMEKVIPRPSRLDNIVRDTASMLRRLLPRSVRLELRIEDTTDGLWAQADPGAVQQVLLNLAANSRDALRSRADGVILISVRRARGERAAGNMVDVSVVDNGEGISADDMKHVFEPLFTTKEIGGGSGLGLAMVRSIMREHDGSLRMASEVGVGTRVTVGFVECPVPPELASEVAHVREGGGERVLVVVGDPIVRESTARVLRRAGYQTDTCCDVSEAHLSMARVHRRSAAAIDLVVCEECVDGGVPALLEVMGGLAASTPLLLCSDDQEPQEPSGRDAGGRRITTLAKPWRTSDLLACVRSLLRQRSPLDRDASRSQGGGRSPLQTSQSTSRAPDDPNWGI